MVVETLTASDDAGTGAMLKAVRLPASEREAAERLMAIDAQQTGRKPNFSRIVRRGLALLAAQMGETWPTNF